jgi:SWI/SNF related-matrix-associated actin-dependent regulator of chromatin subfamily C
MSTEATPKGGGSAKKKAGNRKAATTSNDHVPTTLERDPTLGMNPRAIMTGLYGSRGERIRHTVHDGALRMPREALDLIRDVAAEAGISVPAEYELPGLDTVLRPCIDPSLTTVIVTKLSARKVAVPQPPPPSQDRNEEWNQSEQTQERQSMVHVIRTHAENSTIDRSFTLHNSVGDVISRIRGGGDPETSPTAPQEIPVPAQATSVTATTLHVPDIPTTTGQTPNDMGPCQPVTVDVTDTPMLDATPEVMPPPIKPESTPVAVASSIQLTVVGGIDAPTPATVGSSPASAPETPAATPAPRPVSALGATIPPSSVSSTAPQSAGLMSKPAAAATPMPSAPATLATRAVAPTLAPKVSLSHPAILDKPPPPQYEQLKPGPNDEMISPADTLSPKPSWYQKDRISDLERNMLPEWFDTSAPHRTPASYIATREKVIHIADELANRNLTNALIRRSVVGDAGSLHRLRSFLMHWGLINEDGINDSAPTPAALRQEVSNGKRSLDPKRRHLLLHRVVQQSKRQKIEPSSMADSSAFAIDWEEIALQMGLGVSASDCEREFLTMPLDGGTSTSVPDAERIGSLENGQAFGLDVEELRQKVFADLVEKSNPKVVSIVVQSALQASENNLPEAQNAALVGLVTSRALEHARAQEVAISSTLAELVIQRMEKLENRMALMDDIEGMLEAERVALELERRDLYTARCRHWFGGS